MLLAALLMHRCLEQRRDPSQLHHIKERIKEGGADMISEFGCQM